MPTDSVLLIHPPVVKPSEPPPGIAKLAGELRQHQVSCTVLDANLEGLYYLCRQPISAQDTWTRRAAMHAEKSLLDLTTGSAYRKPERYRQAIMKLNRVLSCAVPQNKSQVNLSNFKDSLLSPVKSDDLIEAYETPDQNLFYAYFDQRMGPLLDKIRPKVIGFSINFLSQALCAFAMIGYVRQRMPDSLIAAGGGLITSWMGQSRWENRFSGIIDHLVPGPGEKALLALMGLKPKKTLSLPVYQRPEGTPYLSPGMILPYSASRGCYWRKCAFCPEATEKTAYRPIPATTVTAQLGALSQRYRPILIHMTDNALSPALLAEMAKAPPGPPWYGFVRITRHLANGDFCRSLRQSGCIMLQIGLESGSQAVLDAFGKGIDLRVAEKALANLKKAGIAAYVYLLFGTPWETEKEAEKTYAFTLRHSANISFLNLAVFNLPTEASAADKLSTAPFYTGDLSLYNDFKHPAGWQRHRVRKFLDKKFRRHPVISKIIQNTPPVFTSNHAAFFSPYERANKLLGRLPGG